MSVQELPSLGPEGGGAQEGKEVKGNWTVRVMRRKKIDKEDKINSHFRGGKQG